MQSTNIPRSICDDIDRKAKNFMWGETGETRKVHLVTWEAIIKPKTEGGLGLRLMRQVNVAFLNKLGWRVLVKPQSLWSRVMRDKCCDGRCDIGMFRNRVDASNAWKCILHNIDTLKKNVNMAVGNGTKTLYWHHRWANPVPLVDIQDDTVSELWDSNNGWKYDIFADFLPQRYLV